MGYKQKQQPQKMPLKSRGTFLFTPLSFLLAGIQR
jgi:hypothetical protein